MIHITPIRNQLVGKMQYICKFRKPLHMARIFRILLLLSLAKCAKAHNKTREGENKIKYYCVSTVGRYPYSKLGWRN